QQRDRLLDSRGGHHGLEIADPALERQLIDLPVGHPAAAVVPTHEPEVVAEEAEPVPPDRALQLVLEVGEPVRRLDEDGSRADFGPGEPNAVFRAQVSDALTKLVHRPRSRIVVVALSATLSFRRAEDQEDAGERAGVPCGARGSVLTPIAAPG